MLLTTANLGLHSYLLFLRSHTPQLEPWAIVRITAEMVAAIYLFLISACYVTNRALNFHSTLTMNICFVAGTTFLHWYLVTLGQALAINYYVTPHWSEYTLFALSGCIALASANVPLGPKLHQDLTKLYSKAVTVKLRESGYDPDMIPTANVNEEVSSTIFGRLMFTFVYPMIAKTSVMDQVDMQDIPAAHAYFRTQNILKESVWVNDHSGVKGKFGPTVSLLYTVWAPEWRAVAKGQSVIVL
jgi:hypothetical protein